MCGPVAEKIGSITISLIGRCNLVMADGGSVHEKHLPNGDIYIGNIVGILPHGKGKYTWSDGTVYDGDWVEGRMTGKGKITWPSGATYDGDFSGGYFYGYGTFTTPESIYRGGWRLNVQHGIARKEYSNSDIYEGSWKEGIREGRGRYCWYSGNVYDGNWKGGNMSGRGVMKWTNGDVFDGFWLNGYRHGSGVYRWADGGFYFGAWSKNLKDGRGTFYPAGSRHPALKKWISSGHHEWNLSLTKDSSLSSDVNMNRKSKVKRISLRRILGSYGLIASRTSSLDANQSVDSGAQYEDGQSQTQEKSNLVYEREYMQGLLVEERITPYAALPRKTERKNKLNASAVKNSSCMEVFEGESNYHLMLNLQLGIRYTVGKITPVPIREVKASDFQSRARVRMYFPRKGSTFSPPHRSSDFYWKDYCPFVFRNLRELFKLDAAEYMLSICGEDGLKEISSPGKSGSIFYISHDDKFVIKTLKKFEVKVLLKMLPAYYNHVSTFENTLITKFFGLHRITLKSGKKTRFVVMGNMFRTELRIHRRYDLKGSSLGRRTDKDKISERTTLKDLDLNFEIQVDKSLRQALFSQLAVDCQFLESQHIMDYSLLLGLHFRAPELLKTMEMSGPLHHQEGLPQAEDATGKEDNLIVPRGLLLVRHEPSIDNDAPGPHIRGRTLKAFSVGDREVDLLLPGTTRLRVQLGVNMPAQANRKLLHNENGAAVDLFEVYDIVLYMGIIDILQEYNARKKIEHACKSLQHDPLQISAVEPKTYAKRFINFVEKVFPEKH